MCHSLFRGIVLNAFEQKKSIRYILGIIFIALMEKYFTLPVLHHRLITGIRSLQTPYYRPIGLAMKRMKALPPAVQKFIEYLPFREKK